jgi:hypothetical protein
MRWDMLQLLEVALRRCLRLLPPTVVEKFLASAGSALTGLTRISTTFLIKPCQVSRYLQRLQPC